LRNAPNVAPPNFFARILRCGEWRARRDDRNHDCGPYPRFSYVISVGDAERDFVIEGRCNSARPFDYTAA
jgi:hypothetical protein